MVQARVQRAIAAQRQPVAQLGEADEDQAEQGAAVPMVVKQDVEVLEGVLVQEMRFVEEKDGMDALLGALLDVARDGVEEAARGGRRRQAEGDAKLAVEVAAAEGGVVAVGQAEAGRGARWRSARSTQVLPTPGSPTRTTEACSVSASMRSPTAAGALIGYAVSSPSASGAKRARVRCLCSSAAVG